MKGITVTYLKGLLARLNPSTALSVLTAALTLGASFGLHVTAAQKASILVVGGAAAAALLTHGLTNAFKYLTPETITGLVVSGIGVAVAFGAPITHEQSEQALYAAGIIATALLGHGVVHTVARDKREPAAPKLPLVTQEHIDKVNELRAAHAGLLELAKTPITFAVEVASHAKAGTLHVASEIKGDVSRLGEVIGAGIHPRYKIGRRAPKNAPALLLKDLLTGVVPEHPATADHFGKLAFGLYGNDKYGVCGPTSVANLMRLVTGGLLGVEIAPSQEDVFDLYRRSGNPTFNPATGAGDEGVDMQTMLEALLAEGIGDGNGGKILPVAFAKVDVKSDAELEAAASIFGGALWGVTLDVAQQAQTDAQPPKWDYKPSNVWGGHAILNGAYETGALEDVESWAKRVETTAAFRSHQLEEAWVVVWPWNLEHPAFLEGVDVAALAAAYKALTGKELPIPAPSPIPVPPAPTPAPPAPPAPVPPAPPAPAPPTPSVEPSAADRALWEATKGWVQGRHSTGTKPVAARMAAWAKTLGLSALLLLLVVLAGCGSTTTSTGTQPALLTVAKCKSYHYVVGPDGKRHRVPCPAPPTPAPTPVPTPTPTPGPKVSACSWQTGTGCSAVPSSCHYRMRGTVALPDPACTPGALYGPSQASPSATVCVSGFTGTIRPPVSYTEPLKLKIMAAYGVSNPANYELDHLVALEDGGAPADPANLWPQPYSPTPGAHQKDDEENFLKRQVCSHAVTVAQAGISLAGDWLASYERDKPPHETFGVGLAP
jgi:hypothetical protein